MDRLESYRLISDEFEFNCLYVMPVFTVELYSFRNALWPDKYWGVNMILYSANAPFERFNLNQIFGKHTPSALNLTCASVTHPRGANNLSPIITYSFHVPPYGSARKWKNIADISNDKSDVNV